MITHTLYLDSFILKYLSYKKEVEKGDILTLKILILQERNRKRYDILTHNLLLESFI